MDWKIIMPVAIAVFLAILVFAIIHRAFRIIIVAIILSMLIPAGFAIMSGNGADYISGFASLFSPSIEQQIKDGYQDFSEKEKQDPVLNGDIAEDTKDALSELWDVAKDKVQSIVIPSR